ncbi:MAG: DUF4263 domain-containing protein [Candidatus Thiodiazotropha sp. (ex Rostrolucina anterorostrata)]|nr:DUF4263 domain-containing protein [Candidatus Thiodiazotropha sp. (ex Rostrolucina anterorostrata)]
MITILEHNDRLLLRYTADRFNDARWIDEKLQQEGEVTLRRSFTFSPQDLIVESDPGDLFDDDRTFVLGVTKGDYYKIDRHILGLKYDLLLSKQMRINSKTFIAYRDISIFRRIDDLIDEQIVIGGDAESSIPLDEFDELIRNFTTSTELTHYARSRITRILKDYLGTISDSQRKLDNYLGNKQTIQTNSRVEFLKDYEPRKFEYVRDELQEMLKDAESYSEKDWQKLIVNFLLLIFPKYIAVLESLHIKDFYTNPVKVADRYIDLTLVDASGTIDIIEIKKPFANCLLSKSKYRDNYTPKTELSGSVMQVEKYMFHLNKWGRNGELDILKKRQHELPPNFEVKITNPKAMIILGRDSDFADDQKFDFEIIKRKYANIMDIMTYDDLLHRLDNIISMHTQNYAKFNTATNKNPGLSGKGGGK